MYHFNEGTIEFPNDWQDQTIHIISAANNNTMGASFTISRDKMPWGMSFNEFTAKEITSISQQLKEYQQRDISNGMLCGKATVSVEFQWQAAQGRIHQLMTFVETQPLILILTATFPDFMTDSQKTQINTILATLTLRN